MSLVKLIEYRSAAGGFVKSAASWAFRSSIGKSRRSFP
jgi:hypothetical protein